MIPTAFSLRLRFLSSCRHDEVNAPALAVSPFVQTQDNFFHGSCDSLDIALFIAANLVLALLDDVALPVRANDPTRRIRRLYRYDFIVFRGQGDDAPLSLAVTWLTNADGMARMRTWARRALTLDKRVQIHNHYTPDCRPFICRKGGNRAEIPCIHGELVYTRVCL